LLAGLEKDAQLMPHTALTLSIALAMAAAGFGLGLGYFAALRRSVALFGAGGSRLAPVALTILRLAAAAAFLVFAARLGAAPLLASFAGFLVARFYALRAARKPA
jgi:hypothetical protein